MAASIPASRMGDSTNRLGAITAAFVLASGVQGETHIVDAKLYGFAIGQLSSSLRAIVGDDEQASSGGAESMEIDEQESQEDRHARLVEERSLDKPVPIPSLSPAPSEKPSRKKKKSKSTQEASACTFGGVFPQESGNEPQNMSDEEFLSLLIRGVVSRNDAVPASAMFSELIEIVRCCYSLQEPQFEAIVVEAPEAEASKHSGKKRAASSNASRGNKKRKKLSDGESATAEDADTTMYGIAPK
jgi:hypothetical protein